MGAKHGTLKDLHSIQDPDPSTTEDRIEKWMAKYIQYLEDFKNDAPLDFSKIESANGELPSITEMSHCNSLDSSRHDKDNQDDSMRLDDSRPSSFRTGRMNSHVALMSRVGTHGSGGMASPASACGLERVPIPENEEVRMPTKGFSCFSWPKKKPKPEAKFAVNGSHRISTGGILNKSASGLPDLSSKDLTGLGAGEANVNPVSG